jgi:hypothetical protein
MTASSGALFALACNQVAGLDGFKEVDCFEAPCVDAGRPDVVPIEAAADAPLDAPLIDAGPNADAGVFEHRTWAHWKMPNPDAGGSPLLPNLMSYNVGPDPKSPSDTIITDNVTKLEWRARVIPAGTFLEARQRCVIPGLWRMPTRIELATLIDFTRTNPALHQVFSGGNVDAYGGGGALRQFWSASTAPNQKTVYWSVNFETGKVDTTLGNVVRCVRGGPDK